MLPKKKQTKITLNTNPPKIGTDYLKYGFDRIEELMKKTDEKTKYLPRTIKLEDLDGAFFNFVNSDKLKLVIDGKKTPCFYLEFERWGEFSKTWKFTDNDKNVPTPFITVRRTNKQPGTRIGSKARIPQQKKFTYLDVPILDDGEVIYLRFKIPQPTNVDLVYEIALFTKYRVDVNNFDEIVLKTFSSFQEYVTVNNNYMPVIFENMSEANTIENIEGDRFYRANYVLKLQGFIQDENEFEITKTLRKTRLGYSVDL